MATIFKLIIEDDEGKTTVYPLADGDLTIGRREGNTIRLMERNVSRRHARLERTNGAVYIRDLDSYNGIKINGERISGTYEVKEGDLVEIGDYHLALQKSVTRSEAPEPAASPDQSSGTWPQAGTVPDFQLPDELLQPQASPPISAPRAGGDRNGNDTIIDQPVPTSVAGVPNVLPPPPDERPKPIPSPAALASNDLAEDGPEAARTTLPPFPGRGLRAPRPHERPAASTAAPPELQPGPEIRAPMPRLICVSTSYAGKSFALTRPELIIGRVEDNDIVVEHRSVSRNHAKILFDGRTHKIIDLQSANGILVNGEEYAMTDLRKGDLIELGHVRFRFVPADEPFRPTPEEAAEMRAAGVAPPPSAADDPDEPLDGLGDTTPMADVAGYDSSQAPTVTDAPLSALEPPASRPAVEHPTPAVAAGSSAEGHGGDPIPGAQASAHPVLGTTHPSSHVSGRAATTPAAYREPRGDGEQRPSDLHRVSTSDREGTREATYEASATAGMPPSVSVPSPGGAPWPEWNGREPRSARGMPAPLATSVDPTTAAVRPAPSLIEPRAVRRRGVSVGLVMIVVIILAVAAAIVLYEVLGRDDRTDRELQALMKAERYEAAVELCDEQRHLFWDRAASEQLCEAANKLLGASSRVGSSPGESVDAPGADATVDPALSEPLEAGTEALTLPDSTAAPKTATGGDGRTDLEAALVEPPAEVPPPPPARPSATSAARQKRLAAKRKAARAVKAKRMLTLGKRYVINGDFARGERVLKECLRLEPDEPDCHRNLGVAYAAQDQPKSAIKHYRRYIELRPDAGDANRVREILRKYKESP